MEKRKAEAGLTLKTVFQSDILYRTDKKEINVYDTDVLRLDAPRYRSVSDPMPDYLDTVFYLHDLEHVTLDFGGAVLYLHGNFQPFILDRCRDVVIRNVTVKYARASYSEFDVVKNTGNELWVREKPDYPCRVENGYLIPYGENYENRSLHRGMMFMQAFDRKTGDGKGLTIVTVGEKADYEVYYPWQVQLLPVREEDGCIVFCGSLPGNWTEGTAVVLGHDPRNVTSTLLCSSEDIRLENYRIINGASFGIMGMHTKNITLDRLLLRYDEKSPGTVSNAADAVHLVACSGDIVMENCEIGGMIDDALNVHGNFYRTERVTPDGILAKKTNESHFLNAYYQCFGEGDRIAVYYGHSMKRKAELTVTGWEVLDACHILLKTDSPPPSDIAEEDLIENLTAQPALKIRNCTFGHGNSHLRIQTRAPSVIENCTLSLPIMLTGDTNFWFEASPTEDLTVSDCRFRGERADIRVVPEVTPTEEEPYYHGKLTVRNCVFDAETAVAGRMLRTLVLSGNRRADGSAVKLGLDAGTEIIQS